MVSVHLASVRCVDVDLHGAALVVIGEKDTKAFQGSGRECADYLRDYIPVGQSVNVRHTHGQRSCMNKPALWADVESYR